MLLLAGYTAAISVCFPILIPSSFLVRFLSSFAAGLGGLALLTALLGSGKAMAQSGRSAAPKRHYTSEGKAYFRGPTYASLGLGVSYYNGDLTSSPGNNFISPAVTLGLWRRMGPHWVLGGELGFVQLAAHGFVLRDYSGNITAPASISFQDNMLTLTGMARYYLVADRHSFAGGVGGTPFVMPFLQAGIGLALINPVTHQNFSLLQSATRTPIDGKYLEPERNDYSAFIGTFPVGTGLTFRLSPELSATLEANYYFTLTDSLDDVELRGDASTNDSFGTVMLKLGLAL